MRLIWTNEGSKRGVPRKEMPFRGLNDVPLNCWVYELKDCSRSDSHVRKIEMFINYF